MMLPGGLWYYITIGRRYVREFYASAVIVGQQPAQAKRFKTYASALGSLPKIRKALKRGEKVKIWEAHITELWSE